MKRNKVNQLELFPAFKRMKLKVPRKYQTQIIELLASIIKEIWEKENGGNDE